MVGFLVLGSRDARRRWFGSFFLIVAAGMLIWGLTVLRSHLKGAAFVIYWLACFGLTGLAVLTALIDIIILRRQARQQQHDLFRKTFSEEPKTTVESDLRNKSTRVRRGDSADPHQIP